MTDLKEITIKVPIDIAEYYRHADQLEKLQIETKIAFVLKNQLLSRTSATNKLRQTMTEIGKKAVANGLTPEILASILNDIEFRNPVSQRNRVSVTFPTAQNAPQ
ncbi:hypothetical protein [Limnospira fusiformis]|uniref:hypothetical protein n=1 Tax=Limnospira fusiformis TaxID=54297 RepID=UPI002AA1998C|nr:hypothetical protein [Limnospira fusiformis LS22]